MNNAARAWLLDSGRWTAGVSLPVTDRAVRYGMAVFETLAVRSGTACLADEHLALLQGSAQALLGISLPKFELPVLEPEDRGVLRLYVTAGDGSPAAETDCPRIFALFEPLGSPLPATQTARLHPEPVAPFGHGLKTANYWTHVTAQAAAGKAGFDHALLADHDGNLLSAAFGNIFLVLDGTLCTPAAELAVRRGVIRSRIMDSRPVREIVFPAARLAEATEVFLTNSRLGVMPLRCGSVEPGPVGAALRDAMQRENILP